MNIFFMTAAVLLISIGLAHSLIGERLLLIPLFHEKSVQLFRKKPYMKMVLRFAWHITTIAWWGLALVIIDFAYNENPSHLAVHSITATITLTGIIILYFSKGRHLAWIVFLAISCSLWVNYLIVSPMSLELRR